MPNASTADARAGWEIYQKSGFGATLEQIDDELQRTGHRPVSERMYNHYGRLAAAGFNRYVSINRFDMSRAANPYENLSLNSRYKFVDASLPASVTFPRGRTLVEARGIAERVGETGLILTFTDPETVEAMRSSRPRIGEMIHVQFTKRPRGVDGRIIDYEVDASSALIEIEYTRLHSISEYVGLNPLPQASHRLVVEDDEASGYSVDLVGRRVYYALELVEASRAVVNEAARLSKGSEYASIIEVEQLQMFSPLAMIIGLPEPVVLVLNAACALLTVERYRQYVRRTQLDTRDREARTKVVEAQAEVEVARARLNGSSDFSGV